MLGRQYDDIAADLGLHVNTVKKYVTEMEKIAGKAGEALTKRVGNIVKGLLVKAINVVEKKLDEGNLKAAEMVFKMSGMVINQETKRVEGEVRLIPDSPQERQKRAIEAVARHRLPEVTDTAGDPP